MTDVEKILAEIEDMAEKTLQQQPMNFNTEMKTLIEILLICKHRFKKGDDE